MRHGRVETKTSAGKAAGAIATRRSRSFVPLPAAAHGWPKPPLIPSADEIGAGRSDVNR
jgi:hypothetical protein